MEAATRAGTRRWLFPVRCTWSSIAFFLSLSMMLWSERAEFGVSGSTLERFLTEEEMETNDAIICQLQLVELWLPPESVLQQDDWEDNTDHTDFSLFADPSSHRQVFQCSPVDPVTGDVSMNEYELDKLPPSHIMDAFQNHHAINNNGEDSYDNGFFISIPGGQIQSETATITIPFPDDVVVVDHDTRQRHLAPLDGNVTLMIVRITDNQGRHPSVSASRLHELVFTDTVSLKSQYAACSRGKLNLVSVIGAPMEVTVAFDAKEKDARKLIQNNATAIALETVKLQHGAGSITHLKQFSNLVMFVFPRMNFVAYAAVGGTASYYNDRFASYLTVQMHEVAHNFGVRHSHEFNELNEPVQYMDYSGVMGGALSNVHDKLNGPRMCFNAANRGFLGWDADARYTAVVDPANGESVVPLIAFVRHADALPMHRTLVNTNVGPGNYWVHYNKKESYNDGTADHVNMLTITHLETSGSFKGSHLIATLNTTTAGEFYVEYLAVGQYWRIEICSIFEETPAIPRTLVVHMGHTNAADVTFCVGGNGGQASLTESPTPFPSSTPSANPTPSPTSAPTLSPTFTPTNAPTHLPSDSPTKRPTGIPSTSPTFSPTLTQCEGRDDVCSTDTDCCGSLFCKFLGPDQEKRCYPNPSESSSNQDDYKMGNGYGGRDRGSGWNRKLGGVRGSKRQAAWHMN